MNREDLDKFLIIRRYLTIVHHVPGRIRLRLNKAIKKEMGTIDKSLIDRVIKSIEGIKDVRINALAGSVVISYAANLLKPDWWETLVKANESVAQNLLITLLENELAPAVKAIRNS